MGRGAQTDAERAVPRAERSQYAIERLNDRTDPDSTVRRNLYCFPTLFDNRTKVLEHLLSSYGTGHVWENGELVPIFDDYTPAALKSRDPEDEFERDRRRWYQDVEMNADQVADLRKLSSEAAARVRVVRENLDELVQTRKPLVLAPAVTEDGPLTTFPDDITDEWLAAVEETAEAILACDRSGHATDEDLNPALRPKPLSPEARKRMNELFDEILGTDTPQQTPEEIAAQAIKERQQRIERDAQAVIRNHEIARRALKRVAKVRAGRAGA